MAKKIIFSWLGNGDVLRTKENKKLSGALAQAVDFIKPDGVCLLNGQVNGKCSPEDVQSYLDRIRERFGDKLIIQEVSHFNPIDYGMICDQVIRFLRKYYQEKDEVFFHQTSGTPSTAVAWILLAQTLFPAQLIQTSENMSCPAEIITLPFNIVADFIPSTQDPVLIGLATDSETKIIHQCSAMKYLLVRTDRVALHNVSVLLLGESGTGKELFAERIHEKSGRKGKLVRVNCGAIPHTLAESEFFGYVKGAFTGASQDRTGKFEEADGGTLFLDEIGELSQDIQAKILRTLQDGTVVKVGGDKEGKVDVRIIAATHRNLMKEVAEGRFREDLFYRLAVGVLQMPPLRDRGNDALLIAEHILSEMNEKTAQDISGYVVKRFDKSAKKIIGSRRWTGNIRELGNTVRRVCIWTDHAVITAADIEAALIEMPDGPEVGAVLDRPLNKGFNLPALVEEVEKHYLKKAYEETAGNKTKAADLLGWSRPTLGKKIDKYEIV